jgi:hypothetical protein
MKKRVLGLRKDGMGILKIARTLAVGTSMVRRVLSSKSAKPLASMGSAPLTAASVNSSTSSNRARAWQSP